MSDSLNRWLLLGFCFLGTIATFNSGITYAEQLQHNPIPNQGDANGDGVQDHQQPNLRNLFDPVTQRYVTLEVMPTTCEILEAHITNGKSTRDKGLIPKEQLMGGLIYFELACEKAQISLYYHHLTQLTADMTFWKWGPTLPGQPSTKNWYQLPETQLAMRTVGTQSVVTVGYTLTDGELGDDTLKDGLIVDPGSMGLDTDYENIISLLSKEYTASIPEEEAVITVNRNGTSGAISVTYTTQSNTANSDEDYAFTTGTLNWADGERGDKTFTVPLLPEATVGQTFTVILDNLTAEGNSSLGINAATVTLTDQVPPVENIIRNFISFSAAQYTGSKNAGAVTLTVNRDGLQGKLLVDYATTVQTTTLNNSAIAGQDYQDTSGTLTWENGERDDKSITIAIPETATAGRVFSVFLSNLRGSDEQPAVDAAFETSTASVTITQEPTVSESILGFSSKGYTVLTDQTTATISVNRIGSQGQVSVNYLTEDGTAVADQDYQTATGTLTWNDGESGSKDFVINLLTTATAGHSLQLKLTELLGPASWGTQTAVLSLLAVPTDQTDPETTDPETEGNTETEENTGNNVTPDPTIPPPVSPLTTGEVTNDFNAGGITLTTDMTISPGGNLSNVIMEGNVLNQGNIVDAVLTGGVINNASISSSTFSGEIVNNGLISNSQFTEGANLTGGILGGAIENLGTLRDFEFVGTSLTGGNLGGTITYNSKVGGTISDVQLLPDALLIDAKLGGTITADPSSTLQNPRLTAGAQLTGGTVTGNAIADSQSQLTDVQFGPGATLTGGTLSGNIQGDPTKPAQLTGVTIAPGTVLSNVALVPPVQLSEGVVLGPGVTMPEELLREFLPEDFSQLDAEALADMDPALFSVLTPEELAAIPPEALAELTPEQLAALPEEAIAALTPEQLADIPPESLAGLSPTQAAALQSATVAVMSPQQFAAIPIASISGFTADNMGALPTAVISSMNAEQVAALNPQAFTQLPSTEIGEFFNHFNPEQVSLEIADNLLPEGWELKPSGQIIPPVGTALVFQNLPISTSPQIALPNLPDLGTAFGLGGQGDSPVEEELNDIFADNQNLTLEDVDLSQFMLSQDEQGILQVRGTGEYEGVDFAFIPDQNEMIQVDGEIPVGLEVIEGGFYRFTTQDSQQFKITPAPKDPAGLSKVLNDQPIVLGTRGDVFLTLANSLRDRGAREVVIFDPLIEPAPTDMCQDVAGELVCDFPADFQPGIRMSTRTRAGEELPVQSVVYEDGTSQKVYPTLLSPDIFIEQGLKFEGVEKITYQADGTFEVIFLGQKYRVKMPNFDVKFRQLSTEEQIEPNVDASVIGKVTYTVTLERPPAPDEILPAEPTEEESVPSETANPDESTVPPVIENETGDTSNENDAELPTANSRLRQTRRDEDSGAREVLVFDPLVEPVAEEECYELDGEVICE